MQLTYVEVLYSKERLKKLNINGNKLNLWHLWYGLNFRHSWNAMWQRRWWFLNRSSSSASSTYGSISISAHGDQGAARTT